MIQHGAQEILQNKAPTYDPSAASELLLMLNPFPFFLFFPGPLEKTTLMPSFRRVRKRLLSLT